LSDSVKVPIMTIDAQSGDMYLLCSDGLSGEVEDDEILRIMESNPDPKQAVYELIRQANTNGGNDNITAIVLRII